MMSFSRGNALRPGKGRFAMLLQIKGGGQRGQSKPKPPIRETYKSPGLLCPLCPQGVLPMPHRPPVSTHLGGIRVAGGEALAARRTREWGGFAGHPDPDRRPRPAPVAQKPRAARPRKALETKLGQPGKTAAQKQMFLNKEKTDGAQRNSVS